MSMPALQAAKHLCEISDWSLTNLSINKILYIANMVHMGRNDGTRLIDENFQAWDYGPVVENVYKALKTFGSSPVRNIFRKHSFGEPSESDAAYLVWAYDSLRGKSPATLVSMTHWVKGAWSEVYQPGRETEISSAAIMREYEARYGGSNGQATTTPTPTHREV